MGKRNKKPYNRPTLILKPWLAGVCRNLSVKSLHAGLQFLDDFWFGLGEVALFANVPGKVKEVQLRRIGNGCLRSYFIIIGILLGKLN